MWSGGRWFCEDRKDWPAERSPWCICCWTCKCDNSRTSWSPGKFFHQFFNSASMQWHFKLREPASDAEMKVDICCGKLFINYLIPCWLTILKWHHNLTWFTNNFFVGWWGWQSFFILKDLIFIVERKLLWDGVTCKFS